MTDRGLGEVWHGDSGQATFEFALVAVAFLAVAMGLMAVVRMVCDGTLVAHAVLEASHTLGQPNVGEFGDVIFF